MCDSIDCKYQTGSFTAALLGRRFAVRLAGGRPALRSCANLHHGLASGSPAEVAATSSRCSRRSRRPIAIQFKAAWNARGSASAEVPILVSSADCSGRYYFAGKTALGFATRISNLILKKTKLCSSLYRITCRPYKSASSQALVLRPNTPPRPVPTTGIHSTAIAPISPTFPTRTSTSSSSSTSVHDSRPIRWRCDATPNIYFK